jgi:hypothetical protein
MGSRLFIRSSALLSVGITEHRHFVSRWLKPASVSADTTIRAGTAGCGQLCGRFTYRVT